MTSTEDKYNIWHQIKAEEESIDHVLDSPWYKTVNELLPSNFKGKILEIGCGRGDFSIYLAQKFPNSFITATDFSSFAIESAQIKINEKVELKNIELKLEDAEHLSFTNESFDLIISCETLEHVNHQEKMLSEIYRVLKKDGRLILTTENYFNGMILTWFKSWLFNTPYDSGSGVQPNENFMICFATYLKFKKADFKNIKTKSTHFQWLLLPKVNPSRLCTNEFKYKCINNLFKPFGRHFTYNCTK